MKLELMPAGAPGLAARMERFAAANAATWRYLPRMRDYYRAYCAPWLAADLGFLVVAGGRDAALCPLFLEERGGVRTLSLAGSYDAAPLAATWLTPKQRREVLRFCFAAIDGLAARHGAGACRLELDPVLARGGHNLLLEHGFLDASTLTALLPLDRTPEVMWSGLRKSYQAIINKTRREFEPLLADGERPDFALHEAYRELHHKAAGRVTRPLDSFTRQYDMLAQGQAALFGLAQAGRPAALCYFFGHGPSAYYGSAADDPDFPTDQPLAHAVIWAAAEYYRERGARWLELGVQDFGHQLFAQPSAKDLSISFFKRGFGGELADLHRGVKYYDAALQRTELSALLERCLAGSGGEGA